MDTEIGKNTLNSIEYWRLMLVVSIIFLPLGGWLIAMNNRQVEFMMWLYLVYGIYAIFFLFLLSMPKLWERFVKRYFDIFSGILIVLYTLVLVLPLHINHFFYPYKLQTIIGFSAILLVLDNQKLALRYGVVFFILVAISAFSCNCPENSPSPFLFALLTMEIISLLSLNKFFSALEVLKNREKTLLDAQNRLHAFWESGEEVIIIIDKHHHVVTYNHRAVDFMKERYADKPILNKGINIINYLETERLTLFFEIFNHVWQEKQKKVLERDRGNGKWEKIVYAPVMNRDGQIWAVSISIVDISIEKNKSIALQESEKNLKAFLDSTRESISILSLDRKLIAHNKVAIEMAKLFSEIPIVKGVLYDDFSTDNERLKRFKDNFNEAIKERKQIKSISKSPDLQKWHEYSYIPIFDERHDIWAVGFVVKDITQEKEKEEAIVNAEQMYRQILNAVEDHILVKGGQAEYIWANKAFHDFHNMDKQQFAKFLEGNYLDGELELRLREYNDYIFETGVPVRVVEKLRDSSGKERTFEINRSPIKDVFGKVIHTVGVGRDITEQVERETELLRIATESHELFKQLVKSKDELMESEQRLRLLADNSVEMISLCTPDGDIIYLSPSTERITGYSRDELYGKNIIDYFHPDDILLIQNESQKQIEGNIREIALTHRFLVKTNEYAWFDSILKFIYDGESEVFSLQTSSRNVTDRVAAEFALQSSELKFRTLFNSGYDAIFIFKIIDNQYLELIETNEVAYKMLGYSPEEMMKLRLTDIEPLGNRAMTKQRIETMIRNKYVNYETVLVSKSGNPIPVEVINTLTKYEGHEVMQTVVRDITERKKVEKIQSEKERVEQSLKVKSDFLANMGHEIRTPMNGIIGMTHLLLESNLSTRQSLYAKTIQQSSKNLLNILNDILVLSKLEAGKMSLNQKAFNIKDTIRNLKQLFAPLLLQKEIHFFNDVLPELPTYVIADETKLLQVLTNLLSNAIKFTQKGKIELRMQILSSTKNGDESEILLKIIFKDTGNGISEENIEHLFEKFYQAQTHDNYKEEGTGLGLSICKELVTLWKGEIGVQSKENEGSTFWFTIPVKEATEEMVQELQEVQEKDTSSITKAELEFSQTIQFNQATILVVEDNQINQEVVRMMLESANCQVTVANNGLEGFEWAAKKSFDLILMDVFMPVMDGVAATQKMKNELPNPPIIIGLSANAGEADSKNYIAKGMDDYLSKPVEPEILFRKMSYWLPAKASKNENSLKETPQTEKTTDIPYEVVIPNTVNVKPNRALLINEAVVNRIKKLAKNNQAYLISLYESFKNDMESMLHESITHHENQEILVRNIHTIKGLSGTIGASYLHEYTTAYYTKIKEGDFSDTLQHLQSMETHFLETLAELKAVLQIG